MLDVLIIGAGPTGLMMAIETVRHGMKCRIIDKTSKTSDKSRALAIQPRTLEVFDHLGLVHEFLKEGVKISAVNPMSGTKRLAHISFKHLDTPYPFVLSLEQGKTERILTEYLLSLGGEIEREIELVDIEDQGAFILGACQDLRSGKSIQIKAKWAVGCDGAHSLVRKKLGFDFIGKALPSVFSLADVKMKWKYPQGEIYAFLNPQGILAAIPMPGKDRYRLIFELERCHDLLKKEFLDIHGEVKTRKVTDPTLDEVKALIKKYADPNANVSDPLWLANFHINSRLVDGYQKGRILIAGDAAHIHSPAGGQGMNSGLQDAFNLGWKLASANKALIETYTLERRSWGKNLLKATHRFTKIATMSHPWAIAVRNWVFSIVAPWAQKRGTEAVSQLSIQYPKSSTVGETGSFHGGPKAGTRATNAPVGQSDLFTLMRGSSCHFMLVFAEGAKELREFESHAVRVIEMEHPEAIKRYGVRKQAVYIIRPDMIVGHRSSPINVEAVRAYYIQVSSQLGF